jgi:Right handed beta helix region
VITRIIRRSLALAVASMGMTAAFAGAALANTQWVNDNVAVGGNTSCADPGFNDIQSAVTAAAPGDTVHVCAGTYTGGVDVPKTLNLVGAKAGHDARTRSQSGESIISGGGVLGGLFVHADGVVVNGFTIRDEVNGPGIYTSPAFSGYRILNDIVTANVFGIYLNTGAGTQTLVQHDLITNNNQPGAAGGNGIYTDQGTQDVLVNQNTFRRNMNSAVLFTNVSPTVNANITVRSNSAVNNASFVLLFGRNNGVTISSNHTNDTVASDNANQGTAVRIDGDANGVAVRHNTILHSPFSGVAVRNGALEDTAGPVGVEIAFNTIKFAVNDGIDVTSTVPESVNAHGNTIRHSRNDGIFFDTGTSGNTIASNSALSSSVWDCQDLSTGTGTAGTANSWTHDIGVKDSPNGLCRRPS